MLPSVNTLAACQLTLARSLFFLCSLILKIVTLLPFTLSTRLYQLGAL